MKANPIYHRTKSNHLSYPWHKWFKKRKTRLKKGEDFRVSVEGIRQQIRNKASKLGIGVSVRIINRREVEIRRLEG
jgi:hypothetical protein